MRLGIRVIAVLLLCAGSLFGTEAVSVPPAQELSLEAYKAEIHRIQSSLTDLKEHPDTAAPLANSIAEKFRVKADSRIFEVDNKALKMAIGEYRIADKARREALLTSHNARLDLLNQGLTEFSTPADLAVRVKLAEVLARREFRSATGLTMLESWKQKISDWIERFLERIFNKLPTPQARNDWAAWVLIAVALVILAIWIKRRMGRREGETMRIPIPFSPSEKNWRTWLAEARAAAAENRWREAVHLAYWAGISNLEESGAWTPDRARTPREYLELISASHPRHDDLLALTRGFELIWYGRRDAEMKDFSEALRHLEVLGCR